MFRFVVRRLRWLARLPGFPQFFDAALLVQTAIFHRPRLAAMEALEASAQQIPGLRLRVHRFGGVAFHLAGRELGHLHGNGLLDAWVGRANRDVLVEARRAEPHHIAPTSGWVSFWLRSPSDAAAARELLDLAASLRTSADFPLGIAARPDTGSRPSPKPEDVP